MALEQQTIDSVKAKLKDGIKIESGNGITQQIAKAAGISLEKGKLVVDKETRNFLIELSKTISTTNGALTPSRASSMRHGFSAAHVVQVGDLIKLDEGEVDKIAATLTNKGAKSKADAPKADAPKADAPKADAPKADAPKADAPKADAPKATDARSSAPEADTLKNKINTEISTELTRLGLKDRITNNGKGVWTDTREGDFRFYIDPASGNVIYAIDRKSLWQSNSKTSDFEDDILNKVSGILKSNQLYGGIVQNNESDYWVPLLGVTATAVAGFALWKKKPWKMFGKGTKEVGEEMGEVVVNTTVAGPINTTMNGGVTNRLIDDALPLSTGAHSSNAHIIDTPLDNVSPFDFPATNSYTSQGNATVLYEKDALTRIGSRTTRPNSSMNEGRILQMQGAKHAEQAQIPVIPETHKPSTVGENIYTNNNSLTSSTQPGVSTGNLRDQINRTTGVQRETGNIRPLSEIEVLAQRARSGYAHIGSESASLGSEFRTKKALQYTDDIEQAFVPSSTASRGKGAYLQLGKDFMVERKGLMDFSLINLKSGQRYDGLKSREEVKRIVSERIGNESGALLNRLEKQILDGNQGKISELARIEGRNTADYRVEGGKIIRRPDGVVWNDAGFSAR